MDGTVLDPAAGDNPAAAAGTRAGWRISLSLWLGLGLTALYSLNLRTDQVPDTEGAILLPIALIRGDGPYLDRFESYLCDDEGRLGWHVESVGGRIVPRYPLGPALAALPLEWPQILILDRIKPGWDRGPRAHFFASMMAKNASTILAALAAVALFHLLYRLGLGRVALPATLAAALGSDLWAVASQAPWQHGPAALALTLAMVLLAGEVTRTRLILSGLAAGGLVAFRAIDIVFAIAIGLWVGRYHARRIGWFLPGPILIGAALLGYNLLTFGAVEGGQSRLEAMHAEQHHTGGAWSGDMLDGAMGTLFSPARGLFVYCPWVALVLAIVPAASGRLGRASIASWLGWALIPYGLLLSKYSVWWAGHCFGPRYWTDATPIFAILLASGLDWARRDCRPLLIAFASTIAWSVAVQAIGAFCYPSTWNERPDVDKHHERLWDRRDTELSRCLAEGVNPRLKQVAVALARRIGLATLSDPRR